MKKYAVLALSSALALSSLTPLQANANEVENQGNIYEQIENNVIQNESSDSYSLSKREAVQQEIDLEHIKEYVTVNSDGHIEFKLIPTGEYEKYNLVELQKHFDILNQNVDNGLIKIDNDLTITDLSIQTYASYGKWTYHWWGYDRKFTKKQANAYVDEIEYVVIGLGAGAIVTAPSIIVSGSFGLSAGWYTLLAKRIQANNKGKKGLTVKIHWSRTFDIVPL